jgi:hypothetical protein
MGSGSFSASSYARYSVDTGRSYDAVTGRTSGQSFRSVRLNAALNPAKFEFRECCNSDEHPNTIPVILALDVTGSMGSACKECADALGVIMTNLYKKFKDIEFCIMGIGDLAYDNAPIQMSQFESDVRIAESLDKVWLEGGGGGNAYESYTAAWYMGLYRTKLDCFDKQSRKGIIITMGDEPLNPYLPVSELSHTLNTTFQGDVETEDLYQEASKKFEIFHIAVDDKHTCYTWNKKEIEHSFGKLLGNHYKVSTIQQLAKTIEECISEAVNTEITDMPSEVQVTNGEISW